ncbi:DUF402 domain-containing protein [Nocardioides sediminis]|uniref:DUF402 domain-containing protein n=1 Tax=Nocardioides sediminis TaxID=433648 RepID=UPI000D2FBD78|nr:DUF402 domain-containing protein [Nocardioides sediminis]
MSDLTSRVTSWEPGTQIMWRYGQPGLDFAAPMTVVRDDDEALVAWLAMGTPVLKLVRDDGRDLRSEPEDAFTAPRRQVESVWSGYSVLRVYRPGQSWSVWHFFHGTSGVFEGWYVNIEDPHVRTGRTTRSRDHVLDVWVEPDRTMERKDEDELLLAVEQGRYTEREADAIRATATEAEEVITAWGAPFCDGWETFRPDPSWPVPALFDGP